MSDEASETIASLRMLLARVYNGYAPHPQCRRTDMALILVAVVALIVAIKCWRGVVWAVWWVAGRVVGERGVW